MILPEVAVSIVAPQVYENCARQLDLPDGTDMSQSDKCHVLTHEMLMTIRGILPIRRELHQIEKDGETFWHYLLAHARPDDELREDDIVTDLTPWQFDGAQRSGFLHAERSHVQEVLERAGAPEMVVALRGIQTISLPHTERLEHRDVEKV